MRMFSRAARRRSALLGLGGALLTAVGDVLILGRSASGAQFDRAEGRIPTYVDADDRWRSLWNGAHLSTRRIQLGTLTGLVGIGLLQGLSLCGIGRAVRPGPLRNLAVGAGAAFAVAGVATHLTCGAVILAYRQVATADPESTVGARPSPRSATRLLGLSAVGSLGALALFSGALTTARLRRRLDAPLTWSAVTPFPCVLTTLLTFGALPSPVGGYARPASISIGLAAYFAVAAAVAGD
jgi:hypothetical protein